MQKSVAFIGAGNMGSRMARRLLAHGFAVLICEKDQDTLAQLVQAGCGELRSPQDAAKFDAVIIMVADDQQFNDVVLGDRGLVHGIGDSRPPVVVVMSTVLPKTLISVAKQVEIAGIRMVDAPVSGGLVGAENGTLSVMVGGKEDDIASILPIIESVGKKIFRCGGLGAGQTVKLINNMIGLTSIYIVAEALDLAVRSDLRLDVLSPILEASTGRTFLSENMDISCNQYARWAASKADFAALSRISLKDMKLAEEFARDAGADLPMLSAVSAAISSDAPGVFERWQAIGNHRISKAV